jgi:hypothetical protein
MRESKIGGEGVREEERERERVIGREGEGGRESGRAREREESGGKDR